MALTREEEETRRRFHVERLAAEAEEVGESVRFQTIPTVQVELAAIRQVLEDLLEAMLRLEQRLR